MKKKDIMTLLLIIAMSAVFSYIISNFLVGGSQSRNISVEVVSDITEEFVRPDSRFFNEDSVNPTQKIQISEVDNNTPFPSQ